MEIIQKSLALSFMPPLQEAVSQKQKVRDTTNNSIMIDAILMRMK